MIELTLWTFPAGDWGDPAAVETLLTQFNSVYPDIHVTVQCLDEATGDDKLSTAVDGGVSPDILLAQPDRLIKAWGAEGMLADLSDMWDDADKQEVNAACPERLLHPGRQVLRLSLCHERAVHGHQL